MRFAGWREYEDVDSRDDRPIERDVTGSDREQYEEERRKVSSSWRNDEKKDDAEKDARP